MLAGDRAGAAGQIPQQVADAFVAHGDSAASRARVAEYRAAGSSEETVSRFFAAIEAGDIGTVREIYAPDAVIWHNDDLVEQPVEENLTVLASLHRAVSGLR